MLWAILAFTGACTNAAYYISNKKFLERIAPLPLAAGGFLAAGAVMLLISFLKGIPELGPWFVPAVLATSVLNIAATTITFRTLTSSDISRAVPMLAFTPVFLIGTAAVILHEFPSLTGIAGIGIIVAGSYVLNTDPAHEGLADPFRDMVRHKGVLAMLVVAFLYAVAINFDKIIVENSDTVFGEAIAFICIGAGFAAMHAVKVRTSADIWTGADAPPAADARNVENTSAAAHARSCEDARTSPDTTTVADIRTDSVTLTSVNTRAAADRLPAAGGRISANARRSADALSGDPAYVRRGDDPGYRRHRDLLLASMFTAILITIEAIVTNTAYTMQIVPYAIAIKRMSTLLVVGFGVLVFHEGGIVRRLLGAALMCLGAILILFFP